MVNPLLMEVGVHYKRKLREALLNSGGALNTHWLNAPPELSRANLMLDWRALTQKRLAKASRFQQVGQVRII
jgi:hypothetical protein